MKQVGRLGGALLYDTHDVLFCSWCCLTQGVFGVSACPFMTQPIVHGHGANIKCKRCDRAGFLLAGGPAGVQKQFCSTQALRAVCLRE